MKQETLLSITMLVSDREDTIEKCLESLQRLRNAVSNELIVVDTAGNEKCMEIVRKYTDKIEHFEWCNDFAAARNVGVRKAEGQWLMYLDDDEWFETTEELEHFFMSGAYKKYNAASYLVRNYFNNEGTDWKDSIATRLVKREKNTCFHEKIHEYLLPLRNPICYLNDYAHHYGYAFKTKQEKIDHSWRNIRPLLEIRKEQPDNYHAATQLLQEYIGAGEYFTAIELAKEVRNLPGCWESWKVRYTGYAAIMEMKLYLRQQRYEEGYRVGQELLSNDRISILANGCILNIMVGICSQMEKYKEAIGYMEEYARALKKWEGYSGKKDMDCFNVAPEYLVREELSRFSLLKIRFLVLQEEWERASEALLGVTWNDEKLRMMVTTAEDIMTVLKNNEFCLEYKTSLEAIYESSVLRTSLYSVLDAEKEENLKERLLKYFSLLSPKDEIVCKYHIMYAGLQRNEVLAKCALEKMRENHYPFFLPDKLYWESLQKLGVSINSYMDEVSTYDWLEMSKRLWALLDKKTSEKAYLCLVRGLEKSDIRFLHISALWMEKRLLDRDSDEMKAEEIWNEMYMVAQYWVSCAATLYKETIFVSDLIEALPPAYQFGWYILQAKSVEKSNTSAYIGKLVEAAKAYPVMKELCKKVMRAAATE